MLRKLFLVLFAQLFALSAAHAIDIDSFEFPSTAPFQQVIGESPDIPDLNVSVSDSSLGGTRYLYAKAGHEPGTAGDRVKLKVSNGSLSQSQDDSLSGQFEVVWDGDTDPFSVAYDGLGGIDFLEDGATAVQIELEAYDKAGATDVTVTLYDAGDLTGDTHSTVTVPLTTAVLGGDPVLVIDLPFGSMTDGPSGGADFSNIGAVRLNIVAEPSVDLRIAWIGTNGECRNLPLPSGSLYDECGVCDGNNDTCLDCLGVINGPDMPATDCDTILPGACTPGQWTDGCFCKSIEEPGQELCDGIDNDCDGLIDENFPLLGDSCSSGEGECKIEGEYICGEDGQLRCDAEIDFDFQFEQCGETIGCDGVPNSQLVPDKCGICGGDGTLCDGCDSVDITETLFSLDAGAKKQEALIVRQARLLKKHWKNSKRQQRKLSGMLERAHELQIRNWVLSWTLPQIAVDCPSEVETCVDVSNVGILDEYRDHADELLKISKRLNRLLKKNGQRKRARTRQRKRAVRLYKENLALADTVPEVQSDCF